MFHQRLVSNSKCNGRWRRRTAKQCLDKIFHLQQTIHLQSKQELALFFKNKMCISHPHFPDTVDPCKLCLRMRWLAWSNYEVPSSSTSRRHSKSLRSFWMPRRLRRGYHLYTTLYIRRDAHLRRTRVSCHRARSSDLKWDQETAIWVKRRWCVSHQNEFPAKRR